MICSCRCGEKQKFTVATKKNNNKKKCLPAHFQKVIEDAWQENTLSGYLKKELNFYLFEWGFTAKIFVLRFVLIPEFVKHNDVSRDYEMQNENWKRLDTSRRFHVLKWLLPEKLKRWLPYKKLFKVLYLFLDNSSEFRS